MIYSKSRQGTLIALIAIQALQASFAFHFSYQYIQIRNNLDVTNTLKGVANRSQTSRFQLPDVREKTTLAAKYGKGAEIYPRTNNDGDFTLADSFPSGAVPPIAQAAVADYDLRSNTMSSNMEQIDTNERDFDDLYDSSKDHGGDSRYDMNIDVIRKVKKSSNQKRKVAKNMFQNIPGAIAEGRQMAKKEKERQMEQERQMDKLSAPSLLSNKLPIATAFAMCVLDLNLISPAEYLWVIFFTGYLVLLSLLASSSKNVASVGEPLLPALPPQRHVPYPIRNPLGTQLTESAMYQNWLKLGVILGYVLPSMAVGFYKLSNQRELAKLCAKSIFFTSCQIITETVVKKIFSPLPIRILVPLGYNSIRMVGLYDWVMFSGKMKLLGLGRALAIGNLAYWGLNLFGFLLPVATLRYMRAHFFCVEAEEVVLREKRF